MQHIRRNVALSVAAVLVASLATATATTSATAAGAPLEPSGGTYDVTITRTEHGIPHIVADDWASLGYGHGYATAQTSICNLADTLITGQGERSRYFGPTARYRDNVSMDATNLQTDTFFTDLHNRHVVEDLLADPVRGPGAEARALVKGYTAGVKRYLQDVGGADGVHDQTCRGDDYLDESFSDLDLWYGVYAANLLASVGPFVDEIADASPPTLTDLGLPLVGGLLKQLLSLSDLLGSSTAQLDRSLAFSKAPATLPSPDELKADLGKDPSSGFGSNATALGGDATTTGRGMLLGNPHFPWHGRYRFAQAHLTIPGQYDVAGAALLGSPVINIGFNKNVAWSHTVSTAYRFTPYEYRVLPGLPTKYLTDHGLKDVEKRTVDVQVKKGDGTETVKRTLYRTEDGYVMDSPDTLMGWSPISVFAMRDANGEHLRTIDSFLNMGKASTVGGLLAAQDAGGGIPWVNTIAADRAGNALYADHSVVPNVPESMLNTCITPIGVVTKAQAGLLVLDGTRARSTCAWKADADAERPGILGPSNLPDATRRDWVANANDSYWLPNPDERLEGFASIIGCEKCERSLRTRMVYKYVTDALEHGPISFETFRGFEHENRVLAAEMTKGNGDLAKTCAAARGGEACDILAAWDDKNDIDSVGAHVFQEFWLRTKNDRWRIPFDAKDPLNTPRDLAEYAVVPAMRDALKYLKEKGIPLDAPLGSLQVADKEGAPIPVDGGSAETGNVNVVLEKAPVESSDALYNITYGSSHIQAVTFTDTGVQASTILTYGPDRRCLDPGSEVTVVDAWCARSSPLHAHQRAEREEAHRAEPLRPVGLEDLGDLVVGVQAVAEEPDAHQVREVEVAERHGVGVAERS
jgi:acyl-homoserine-lactone acylase